MEQINQNWMAEWRKLDTSGRGTLTFAELPVLVERLGVELTDDELESAASRIQKWQASRILAQGFARWFTGDGGRVIGTDIRVARNQLRESRAAHARKVRSLAKELDTLREDKKQNLMAYEDALSTIESLNREHTVKLDLAMSEVDLARTRSRDLESKYDEMRHEAKDLRERLDAQKIEYEARLEQITSTYERTKELLHAATTKSTGDRLRAMGAALIWRNVFFTLDRAATLRTQSAPTMIQSVWRGSLERKHSGEAVVIPTSPNSRSNLDKKHADNGESGDEDEEETEISQRDEPIVRALDTAMLDDESSLENLELDQESEPIKKTPPRKQQELPRVSDTPPELSFDDDEPTTSPGEECDDSPDDETNVVDSSEDDGSVEDEEIGTKIFVADDEACQLPSTEDTVGINDRPEEEEDECVFDLDDDVGSSEDDDTVEHIRPSEELPLPPAPKISASPLRSSLKSGSRPRRRVSLGSSDSMRVVCFNSEDPPSVIAETPDEPREKEMFFGSAVDADSAVQLKTSSPSRTWGANLAVPSIGSGQGEESTSEDDVYGFEAEGEEEDDDEYDDEEDYEFEEEEEDDDAVCSLLQD